MRNYQRCEPVNCACCKLRKPKQGGEDVISEDGLHRRFRCADCKKLAEARDAKRATA